MTTLDRTDSFDEDGIGTDARTETPAQAASLTGIAIRSSYRVVGAAPARRQPPGRPLTPDNPAAAHPPAPPSEAIIDWWDSLAGDLTHPPVDALDRALVERNWPNSLLLRRTDEARRPNIEAVRIFLPAAGSAISPIPVDAMGLERIISLAREVISTGAPIHERDALPTMSGPVDCAIIALPFGQGPTADHALCHVYRPASHAPDGRTNPRIGAPASSAGGRIRRLFGGR